MTQKLVSVSIPTLNSERTIGKCLRSILSQTYAPIEIIVVDAYSSDSTVKIASEFGARVFFGRGLTKQRFKCIRESQGEYMLLLDSDQVISNQLVEKCVEKLEENDEIRALVLRDKSIRMFNNHLARWQSKYMESGQLDAHPLYGTALPRFFRADALRKIRQPLREIGYFDHAWIYLEFVRMGYRVGYVDAETYHIEYNHPTFIAGKFRKHYGHHLIPALVENWKLVFSKGLPKRMIFGSNQMTMTERFTQVTLYGFKAICTISGIFESIISRFI